MKTLRKVFLALAIVSIAAVPVLAKQHGGDGFMKHKGHKGMNMERLKVALDLTEQQQADIQQIINQQREKVQPVREQAQLNRDGIRELMDQENLDEAKLQALMQEQSKLRTEMMIERHATRAKIDQVLTPEQRQKHEELRELRQGQKKHKRFARYQEAPQ